VCVCTHIIYIHTHPQMYLSMDLEFGFGTNLAFFACSLYFSFAALVRTRTAFYGVRTAYRRPITILTEHHIALQSHTNRPFYSTE
jgi:hypothetical protein